MRRVVGVVGVLGWVAACSSGPPDLVVAPVATAALPAAAPDATAVSHVEAVPTTIEWVEDDVAAALATARADKKVVLVDAWAPWCHTCIAMKTGVLAAPPLAAYQDRVVFASIDTDRPENASFIEHYEIGVWPTFFVLEPTEGAVVGMLGGAAGLAEIQALLDRGVASQAGRGDALEALARADAAFAKGDADAAASAYEEAAKALEGGPGRSSALLGWIRALNRARAFDRCVEIGREHLEQVTGAAAPQDFSFYLRSCANGVKDPKVKRELRERVLARLETLAATPDPASSVDDRADLLAQLADTARELSDAPRARRADEDRLAIMVTAAEAADTPLHAMAYDYQRAGAYLALGRGEEAVAMLAEREGELPMSYEPPARLAWVLAELERYPEALAAIDRALERSYGPRRFRYLRTKADLLDETGDREGAKAALKEALAGFSSLEGKAARPADVEAIEKRLAEWEKGGKPKPKPKKAPKP